MTQQSHFRIYIHIYIKLKTDLEEIFADPYILQHYSKQQRQENNLKVHLQMNGQRKRVGYKRTLFSLEKEGNPSICNNTDKPGGH